MHSLSHFKNGPVYNEPNVSKIPMTYNVFENCNIKRNSALIFVHRGELCIKANFFASGGDLIRDRFSNVDDHAGGNSMRGTTNI